MAYHFRGTGNRPGQVKRRRSEPTAAQHGSIISYQASRCMRTGQQWQKGSGAWVLEDREGDIGIRGGGDASG